MVHFLKANHRPMKKELSSIKKNYHYSKNIEGIAIDKALVTKIYIKKKSKEIKDLATDNDVIRQNLL